MSQLLGILQPVFKKIGDFFDLFDLSFFIAGASSLLALVYSAWVLGLLSQLGALDGGSRVVLAVVMVAVWGLLSFAVGPLLYRLFWGRLDSIDRAAHEGRGRADHLKAALERHGLLGEGGDELAQSHADRGSYDQLYTRLWVEIRERSVVRESFDQLRRFWILTASYEALATSGLFWAIALLVGAVSWTPEQALGMPPAYALGAAAASLVLGGASAHEAGRSRSNQVEEVVATYAFLRDERERTSTPS